MSAIDTQNAKNIRDTMQIVVKVGESSDPYFEFDNSNLLSCELQLRSDLKPIDPTLPESEIIIRAYYPEDISEELITIADDTVITYQAGYEGDLSPVRTFYLAEQIQWEANVLTVHGVDAVHFLDVSAPPRFIGNFYDEDPPGQIGLSGEGWGSNTTTPFAFITTIFNDLITRAGVSLVSTPSSYYATSSSTEASLIAGFIPRQTYRNSVANLMNLCHIEFPSGTWSGSNKFWLTYVDAGRPKITYSIPSSSFTIYEADCGDIQRHIDKNIVEIDAKLKRLDISPYRTDNGHPSVAPYQNNQEVGTAEIFKNKGAGLSINGVASIMDYVVNRDTVPEGVVYNKHYICQYAHPNKRILPIYIWNGTSYRCGTILRDGESDTWQDYTNNETGTSYHPTLSDFWNALVTYEYIEDTTKETFTVKLFGGAYNTSEESKSYSRTGSGIITAPSSTSWGGSISARSYNSSSNIVNILPDAGFNSLMNRSNETGSFTWKGDPRMQPRDVFTFVYRDGTTELRTIETINLKHEGGGTVATITYRKGIV